MAREYDYINLFEKANKEIDLLENSGNKQEQEIFIEVKMALLEIKQLCEADKNVPIWVVVQKYYDKALTYLLSSQEKKLKDAEKYCILQKETKNRLKEFAKNRKEELWKMLKSRFKLKQTASKNNITTCLTL